MYMYVGQSENVYSKVQMQAANLKNQKFKTVFTDWLEFLRIKFTNFKTLSHEFSIYDCIEDEYKSENRCGEKTLNWNSKSDGVGFRNLLGL